MDKIKVNTRGRWYWAVLSLLAVASSWPLSLAHSPQYVWYLELREGACAAGAALKSRDEISTLFDEKGIEDPYTRIIGIFALTNCL